MHIEKILHKPENKITAVNWEFQQEESSENGLFKDELWSFLWS